MPIEEITWDSNGKPTIRQSMTATGGCTGRTFEEEVVRIARSGNYEYVRDHVFSGLLRRAEVLYGEVENLTDKYNTLSGNSTEKYNGLVGEWNELKDKYNGFIDKYNDLARNSVSKESAERLENEYRKNVADYNRLVGEHNGLQEKCRELTQRFNRLNEDIEELRERSEEMRTRHEEETRRLNQDILMISRSEERLRQEGIGLREQLADIRNERDNLLIRVDEKNQEILALTNQMADLRIESNNQNNQLQNVQRELVRVQAERDERITATDLQELILEIENKDREISSLREQLGQSRESGLTERIRSQERRLEGFIHRLGIELEQIQLLRDIYNELVRSRRDGDMNGIRENQNIIDTIKQNFLQARVSLEDVQEMCDKCEEIAQLNLQLGQQFEARQQQQVIPPHRRF